MDKHEKGPFFQTLSSFLVVCNVLRFSSDTEDRKIFLGFKFSSSGFFLRKGSYWVFKTIYDS